MRNIFINVVAITLSLLLPGYGKSTTTDEALKMAKQSILCFQESYPKRELLSVDELVGTINQWKSKLAKEIGLQDNTKTLDQNAIHTLLAAARSEGGVIFMRHGEQQMSPWVEKLPSKAEQKIAMMRQKENMANPVTPISVVEAYSMILALEYVSRLTNTSWIVETSGNNRAAQIAELLAVALSTKAQHSSRWDCINYPDEDFITTDELLAILPEGTLPWEKGLVDQVIGKGAFDRIHWQVREAIEGISTSKLTVFVTHTQQISAAADQYNQPVQRLSNYGFVIIPGSKILHPITFEKGLFR